VQKGILEAFPSAELEVLIVWISMMSGDTFKAAQKAVKKFKDGRVQQFYDPQQLSGRAFAKSLGHSDKVAWDIYLFYSPGTTWGELPPPPDVFMHQLRGSWADQSRLFEKDQLRVKLTETMKLLFPK
jgi:hypothetical protein